jgi:hypothetical protein
MVATFSNWTKYFSSCTIESGQQGRKLTQGHPPRLMSYSLFSLGETRTVDEFEVVPHAIGQPICQYMQEKLGAPWVRKAAAHGNWAARVRLRVFGQHLFLDSRRKSVLLITSV